MSVYWFLAGLVTGCLLGWLAVAGLILIIMRRLKS